MVADEAAEEIEVGATGPDLRYWATKEALRQAEAKLKSQSEALAGILTRATTTLGWAVTASLALAAALVAEKEVAAVSIATVCMLASGGFSLGAIWPREWGTASWDVAWLLAPQYPTELQFLDAMARGAKTQIRADQKKIERCARLLSLAYLCLFLAPLLGGAALLLFNGA